MRPLDDLELTPNDQLPLAARQPVPAGLSASDRSAGPQGAGGSNRPIPLKPRAGNELPDAYDDDDDDDATEDLKEVLRHAPAWLVSTVFHMLLLIVLGLLAVTTELKRADMEIEVGNAEEELGTQLEDPSVLEGNSPRLENVGKEQLITPTDLAPVDDPLAAPLAIGDLKLGPGPGLLTGPTTIDGAPIGLALKGRQIGSRNVLLGKYGGTPGTEAAVEKGLAWLAKQQRTTGLWSLTGPYADGSQTGENTVAATAMALLAFQGHGDTHRDGKYAKNVDRGWSALRKLQRKDGLFSGAMASQNELLYAHAQATIALCELYGMTKDSLYREPARRAIEYACNVQDKKNGGWRYQPGVDSDTSVTGWFVMALQSARMAGLKVPEETLKRVTAYLDSAQVDDGRRYGYVGSVQWTHAVTAEALLCRQYLGWPQDDPRLVEGVAALNQTPIAYINLGQNAEAAVRAEENVYYWYYATQATHHMEGKIWDDWNKVMRVQVPAHQVKKGPEEGSWNPLTDQWGGAGGRLYVTCLSIYILEVYYRHLPIYSGFKAFAAAEANTTPSANADDNGPPATTDEPAAKKADTDAAENAAEGKSAPDGAEAKKKD